MKKTTLLAIAVLFASALVSGCATASQPSQKEIDQVVDMAKRRFTEHMAYGFGYGRWRELDPYLRTEYESQLEIDAKVFKNISEEDYFAAPRRIVVLIKTEYKSYMRADKSGREVLGWTMPVEIVLYYRRFESKWRFERLEDNRWPKKYTEEYWKLKAAGR